MNCTTTSYVQFVHYSNCRLIKGFRMVTAEECWHKSLTPLMAEVRDMMGDRPVYVSFDIDGLDPAFAPGTGLFSYFLRYSHFPNMIYNCKELPLWVCRSFVPNYIFDIGRLFVCKRFFLIREDEFCCSHERWKCWYAVLTGVPEIGGWPVFRDWRSSGDAGG